jgi:hypothetical protein
MLAIVPELSTIKRSLCVVDFELPEEDRDKFYVYALNNIYHKDYPYPYNYCNEYRPPKYFRTLLKEIKPLCPPICL